MATLKDESLECIVLVNNQHDTLFECVYLFHCSTCFEQPSAHSQGNQLYQYIIWCISLCVGGRLVCQSAGNCSSLWTGIPDSHLHRVIYTRCVDTVGPPDDEHWVAWNV